MLQRLTTFLSKTAMTKATTFISDDRILEILDSGEFKRALEDAIEDSTETDYEYDGIDEYAVERISPYAAARNVIDTIKKFINE